MVYFYITGTVLFTIYGQLILKWRISKYGTLPDDIVDKIIFLVKLIFDPFIFSGLFAAFVASLFWMATMTKADLSFAYPFITAGLTLLTVSLAIILFNESISLFKFIGIFLILIGVIVMAYSETIGKV